MSSNTAKWRWAHGRRGPSWRLFLAVLLVLPPAWRWWSPAWRDRAREPEAQAELEAIVSSLKLDLESARRELERLRSEARTWGQIALPDRYEKLVAEVLPLSDPSPRRQILWALLPGSRELLRSTPVLCGLDAGATAAGAPLAPGVLVGRALSVAGGLPFVRIETTLDPAFRVRFRHHGASGVLWGTGDEIDGKPVLEIKHLTELVELKEGEPVVTEGRDGVYPEGLLIGVIAREVPAESAETTSAPSGRLIVLGAVVPHALEQVVLAVDRVQESLAHLQANEAERTP